MMKKEYYVGGPRSGPPDAICARCGKTYKNWLTTIRAWSNVGAKWRRKFLCIDCFEDITGTKLKMMTPEILNRLSKRGPGWYGHPKEHSKAAKEGWIKRKRYGTYEQVAKEKLSPYMKRRGHSPKKWASFYAEELLKDESPTFTKEYHWEPKDPKDHYERGPETPMYLVKGVDVGIRYKPKKSKQQKKIVVRDPRRGTRRCGPGETVGKSYPTPDGATIVLSRMSEILPEYRGYRYPLEIALHEFAHASESIKSPKADVAVAREKAIRQKLREGMEITGKEYREIPSEKRANQYTKRKMRQFAGETAKDEKVKYPEFWEKQYGKYKHWKSVKVSSEELALLKNVQKELKEKGTDSLRGIVPDSKLPTAKARGHS